MEAGSATLRRRLGITDAVRQAGFIRTESLAEQFAVSAVTIRSDLAYLQGQNLVIRTNGGAQAPMQDGDSVSGEDTCSLPDAHRLARRMAERLSDGDCVFLDSSLPASLVPLYAQAESLRFLIQNLETFMLVRKTSDATLFLIGGEYDRSGQLVASPAARQALSLHAIDLAVIVVRTFSDYGYDLASSSGGCSEVAIRRARQTVLLAASDDPSSEPGRLFPWQQGMTVLSLCEPPSSNRIIQPVPSPESPVFSVDVHSA